ncbi:MAG: hypothetical protein MUF15_28095 [Acidobacteria bacterium]|nr:hypothetical protein [Acidobacteriota bacterium]
MSPIKEGVYQWLTVKDENVYWGQNAEFTMHVKNTTNEPKSLTINNPFFDFGHGNTGNEFPPLLLIFRPVNNMPYATIVLEKNLF